MRPADARLDGRRFRRTWRVHRPHPRASTGAGSDPYAGTRTMRELSRAFVVRVMGLRLAHSTIGVSAPVRSRNSVRLEVVVRSTAEKLGRTRAGGGEDHGAHNGATESTKAKRRRGTHCQNQSCPPRPAALRAARAASDRWGSRDTCARRDPAPLGRHTRRVELHRFLRSAPVGSVPPFVNSALSFPSGRGASSQTDPVPIGASSSSPRATATEVNRGVVPNPDVPAYLSTISRANLVPITSRYLLRP